ncbi:MAG: SDR family oxidoreductase [Alphaproteobacteria bacterium]|nr:SDR family oxidoreductase [Alphaproteobacteria bacterium]
MADDEERPLPLESRGEAPGRGRLAGRRVLVVGGGQRTVDPATDSVGNGRAMSVLFAREGASVAVADKSRAAAAATAALIGPDAVVIEADIASPDSITRMIAEAVDKLDGLDALALNVGVGVGALGLEGANADDWDTTLAINLRGPMLCCRAALPHMTDGGAIVFISSIAGLKPGSRLPAYDASKSALHALMRHVAFEGARRGVRANVVCPGLMDTPLGRAATQGRPSRGRTPTPLGRQGTGWETAYAALFLISDESAYVDGQILAVDGGLSALS